MPPTASLVPALLKSIQALLTEAITLCKCEMILKNPSLTASTNSQHVCLVASHVC